MLTPEQKRAYNKAYAATERGAKIKKYHANKWAKSEKGKAAVRKWAKANRVRNREAVLERARAYKIKNREKLTAYEVAHYRMRRVERPWMNAIYAAKTRATRKRLMFDLTFEWGEKNWTGKCALSGLPFNQAPRVGGPNPFAASLDRVDPAQGYVQTNCRFILYALNAFKGRSTDEEMAGIAAALCRARGIF